MSQFSLFRNRICVISLILTIGYAFNFISILESITTFKHHVEIWLITYLASSIWLFMSCLFLVIITLCGFKINILSAKKRFIALFLIVIGLCGYIPSSIIGLLTVTNTHSKFIFWQFETLYSLLSLYLACLIYFFDHKTYIPICNLVLL
eukprot:530011_1